MSFSLNGTSTNNLSANGVPINVFPITLMFWVKASNIVLEQSVLGMGDTNTDDSYFRLGVQNSLSHSASRSPTAAPTSTVAGIAVGTWCFIAAEFAGSGTTNSSNQVVFATLGNVVSKGSLNDIEVITNFSLYDIVRVGRNPRATAGTFFNGLVAFGAIVSKIPSAAEYSALTVEGKPPGNVFASNRVCYWDCTENLNPVPDLWGAFPLTVNGGTFSTDNPPLSGDAVAIITGVSPINNTESFTISGTGFGAAQGTVSIGGVAQTITSWLDGSVVCTAGIGTLKYGTHDLTLTDVSAIAKYAVYPVPFNPVTGHAYVNLSGTLAPVADRLTAVADLAVPDQLEYNLTTGSGAMTVYPDASFVVDQTVTAFQARANDGTGWGTYGAQTLGVVVTIPPSITTTLLNATVVGTPFSQTLAASGDLPITWDVSAGTLPTGLALSTVGGLSGTPTTGQSYSFTARATNSVGFDTQAYNGNVTQAPLITVSALGTMRVGVAFSEQVVATGFPVPTFALFSGTLPAGLTLSAAGLVSGTPTTAAAYSFTPRATNSTGFDDQLLTGTVLTAFVVPVITTVSLGTITQGVSYSLQLVSTGNPVPTWDVSAGTMIQGLSLSTTGLLSGIPTQSGAYNFTARATNSQGNNIQNYTGSVLVALAAPVITTIALNPLYQTVPFSQQLQATGNPVPTYAVTVGTLPAGLTLTAGGLLSGTPTTIAAYSFTVTATNSQGSDPQAYTGNVVAGPAAPNITTTVINAMLVGVSFSQQIAYTGDPVPTFVVSVGTLPDGISLSAGGLLSGVPTAAAAYSFTVLATNTQGSDTQAYSATVNAAPVITSGSLAQMYVGAPFSQTLLSTGTAPITFTVFSGTLPVGLALSTAGVLSGTPTTAAAYNVTIRATNAYGIDDQTYTGSVAASPSTPQNATGNDTALAVFSAAAGGTTLNEAMLAFCQSYGSVTGQTLNGGQMAALAAQGFSTGTLADRWAAFFDAFGCPPGTFNDRFLYWLRTR